MISEKNSRKTKSLLFSNINRNLRTFALVIIVFTSMAGLSYALPSFPGAQGFGSDTKGGRSGRVIEVTNLNDSGPGSLREAVTASGPRIVVFRTGGTVNLNGMVTIRNPYITIAGQTAPGDGITIKGGYLVVATHDVIIRGIRTRSGDITNDGFGIFDYQADVYNVIIDHCSMSWSTDENTSTWYDAYNVTYQYNIISEGLVGSTSASYGMLIGGTDDGSPASENISIHHNLFAHNRDRNALFSQDTKAEFINNLVYNWQWYATRTFSAINIIGNHYKTGPGWTGGRGITVQKGGLFPNLQSNTVYVKDNIGPNRTSNTGSDWDIVNGDSQYQASSPPFPLSNVTINPVEDVYSFVTANAGVTAPTRDSVDNRIINEVKNGTGIHPVSQNDVGGWPALAKGTPPTDTDGDGMPDQWELAKGLAPNDSSDGNKDRNGDGYTNVEEYINSLIVMPNQTAGSQPSPPTGLRLI